MSHSKDASVLPEFVDWNDKVKHEIKQVYDLLKESLSDEPAALINDLTEIECWNSRMGTLLAQANSWLDRYTLIVMPTKEGRTEADRKAFVDSEVSPIRLVRDTLESLCESIKQRLILGESVLSFHKAQYAERRPITQMERVY